MKKIFFIFVVACFSVALAANAEEPLRYVDYGGCELIVKHCTNWTGGSWMEYGLAKHGRIIVEPKCEMWYNEGLHIFVFRCHEGFWRYRVEMFYSDTGEHLYSYRRVCTNSKKKPYITFQRDKKDGKCINALMNEEGYRPYVIGTYYRRGGKTYRREECIVIQDVPLSSQAQCTSGQCGPTK